MHLPQNVDGVGVHLGFFVAPPVAHDPVNFVHGFGDVGAAALVKDRNRFLGVDVCEGDCTGVGEGGGQFLGPEKGSADRGDKRCGE